MRIVLAYGLVLPLVQFCLWLGAGLGFVVALPLAWAPARFRVFVAGTLSGVFGVAAAVAFGWGVFRVVVGPGSFGLGPLLASTIPLAIPIYNDFKKSQQMRTNQGNLPAGARGAAASTTEAFGHSFWGEILGLILAGVWFFLA